MLILIRMGCPGPAYAESLNCLNHYLIFMVTNLSQLIFLYSVRRCYFIFLRPELKHLLPRHFQMLPFCELFPGCTVVAERPLSSQKKSLPLQKDVCNVSAYKCRYEATDIQGKNQMSFFPCRHFTSIPIVTYIISMLLHC